MKKHTSSRSGLLLMEIIIAILFFSIVSAICLQLFVKSHNLGRATEELDMAVRQAGSAAEILSRSDRPMEQLEKVYPDSDLDKKGGSVYFDQDFQVCDAGASAYHMDISEASADDRLTTYLIAVYTRDDPEEIYSLEVTAYTPLAAD